MIDIGPFLMIAYNCPGIGNIQFSPDGSKVYFESSKWPGSAELWMMNFDGSHLVSFGSGNDTKIISESKNDKYKGYLVTDKAAYVDDEEKTVRVSWFVLLDPNGKIVKEIGADLDNFMKSSDIKFLSTLR